MLIFETILVRNRNLYGDTMVLIFRRVIHVTPTKHMAKHWFSMLARKQKAYMSALLKLILIWIADSTLSLKVHSRLMKRF